MQIEKWREGKGGGGGGGRESAIGWVNEKEERGYRKRCRSRG